MSEHRPLPEWFSLATRALHASIRKQYEQASELLSQLNEAYGPDMPNIMLAWIDTMLRAVHDDIEYRPGHRVIGINADTLAVDSIDTPEPVVWCQALIAARLNDDEAGFKALLGQVQVEAPAAQGLKVGTLLQICGMNTRSAIHRRHQGATGG